MIGLRLLPHVVFTEALKLKRTLALGMAFYAPLSIVILYCMIGSLGPSGPMRQGGNVWAALAKNTSNLWTLLMLPLFITLETSLLAGLEHTDRNWKFVLTLPTPKWTIYVAKLIVSAGLVWLAHVVLIVGSLISGQILKVVAPHLGIVATPLAPLVIPMAKISLAMLLPLTIQHWVSLRWPTFTAAMGFGMVATVMGFVAVNSPEWGPWFPWSLPLHAIDPRPDIVNPILMSGLGAAMVATWGAWRFTRREIA
jgi:hypothetical protein